MDNLLNDMGQRLSKRRKQLGLTQEQLAEKAKTTTQTISTAETGRKALRPENILKLCDALDISIDYLFRGEFNNEDFTILSTKISQLTPEQYQYLETIIDTFIAAVASNKKRHSRFGLLCLSLMFGQKMPACWRLQKTLHRPIVP